MRLGSISLLPWSQSEARASATRKRRGRDAPTGVWGFVPHNSRNFPHDFPHRFCLGWCEKFRRVMRNVAKLSAVVDIEEVASFAESLNVYASSVRTAASSLILLDFMGRVNLIRCPHARARGITAPSGASNAPREIIRAQQLGTWFIAGGEHHPYLFVLLVGLRCGAVLSQFYVNLERVLSDEIERIRDHLATRALRP
jgi:hypothetical protein